MQPFLFETFIFKDRQLKHARRMAKLDETIRF
jgi:hypothetical protein